MVALAAGGQTSLVLASYGSSQSSLSPHDATLSGLTISDGLFSPTFSSNTLTYSATVPNTTSSVTVTPTLNELYGATVKVNGVSVASGTGSPTIPLLAGINTITLIVTAADGVTKSTYTVVITRAGSSLATLSSLALSSGSLSPVFNSTTTSYTVSVGEAAASITATPTAADPTASIRVNDVPVTSASASGLVPLSVGANIITVVVTAQNGTTTKTYTVTVTRDPPPKFSEWVAGYAGLADNTASGDPDRDGIPNLIEYVLNGNPSIASCSILPRATSSEGGIVFTFNRRVSSEQDTTQVFQHSPNLVDWTNVRITFPTDFKVTLGAVDSEGNQTVTVTIPNASNANLFGRLKVTQ